MPGGNSRKITFPADSVLNAVIQDGDVYELGQILHNRRGEFNINQTNHVGLTALHHAVLSKNLDAVKMLLCGDSDVNAKDIHGFSPLHTASACGFLQISSLLLLFGADVFSLTKQMELPVDVAKDISIVRLLTAEMYSRIQTELYFQTLVTNKLINMWSKFRTIAMFVLRLLYTLVKYVWQRSPITFKQVAKKQVSVAPGTVNGGTRVTNTENNNKQKKKNKPMVKIE
ncbi:protein phosphatase 1 regulatory inhibitor subunit 16B-like [Pecten maximus]|uniref:protein phosphatase 1 regulatory inhibitor subunit 16B-like n=1 Tax=Pecten maximus TaxID=6579 RepID=UPI0014587E8D|nr:protein phosphatase 1 regulatory inhibitor subunit 16B-like [Pecten maximus]XP_033735926.1 protein phosphatase 1 regulatory inhibitor subunit 16B-like [Pecten maximus]XP_033735927.1 protein phosphatase 1 regulatory inhibitor subunit 16B-like [Pecten maximus]XP_033735928.1 protein phosphatase 1 regulatory inhibitor subunit 16B-like [Pecten maximus]